MMYNYMAILKETFNKITILGECKLLSRTNEGCRVELTNNKIVTCESVVPLDIWCDYVDERFADVEVVKL